MRQLPATEARRQFFRLLDLALSGETVMIERKGVPLKLVPVSKRRSAKKVPDYTNCIHSNLDEADQWSWDWHPGRRLVFKTPKTK